MVRIFWIYLIFWIFLREGEANLIQKRGRRKRCISLFLCGIMLVELDDVGGCIIGKEVGMECPDEVFENKVGAGNGTLPKVVGSVGKGATIEGVYPTLAG